MEDPFIGRITEFYEKEDKSPWFAAQWFFRSYDTVSFISNLDCVLSTCIIILLNGFNSYKECVRGEQGMGKEGRNQDPKRIFYSDVKDDNELHVIVEKINIVRIASKV